MVQADFVEGILQRDDALYLVRLDHGGEHIAHRKLWAPLRDGIARKPVGNRENTAKIVGRMAPFGRQPSVVEIEPAAHGPDVEGSLDRIELKGRSGNPGSVRNHTSGN